MNCEGCEEGAYVIDVLAKLLAEIAIIVNGPEPPLTRWSYHDLPEKVRALKQAQQPAAAVPASAHGYVDEDRRRIVSDMQSMRDRLGGFLAKTYGDQFDGDIDLMLEAINFMKAVRIEKPAAAVPEGDIFEAYKSWPEDIRKKLSAHDLRRMAGWAPRTRIGDWAIDTSAGRPILTYKACSVIEAEDARYVLSLLRRDAAQQPAAAVPEGYALVPVEPTVAMIDRAVDGWEQFWTGYVGIHRQDQIGTRAALEFALQQALGVRP